MTKQVETPEVAEAIIDLILSQFGKAVYGKQNLENVRGRFARTEAALQKTLATHTVSQVAATTATQEGQEVDRHALQGKPLHYFIRTATLGREAIQEQGYEPDFFVQSNVLALAQSLAQQPA